MNDIIEKLETILQDRKNKDPEDSYVSSLYSKGNQYICDKITEEASELAVSYTHLTLPTSLAV